jgi:histidyl-tRNA synthetase
MSFDMLQTDFLPLMCASIQQSGEIPDQGRVFNRLAGRIYKSGFDPIREPFFETCTASQKRYGKVDQNVQSIEYRESVFISKGRLL